MQPCYAMAKQLHFNKDGSALKKMQAGVDKLASVVGITLGPKVHVCTVYAVAVCVTAMLCMSTWFVSIYLHGHVLSATQTV